MITAKTEKKNVESDYRH